MEMNLIKMDLMKKKKRKGFTLIELIVVIAIIGILAAIAVPRFGGFTSKAKNSSDQQAAVLIEKAAKAHYAGTTPNAYPAVNAFVSALGTAGDNMVEDNILTPATTNATFWFRSSTGDVEVLFDTHTADAAATKGGGVAADWAKITN